MWEFNKTSEMFLFYHTFRSYCLATELHRLES